MKQESFGVVIAVTDYDWFMAKACCASVHHFMPGVPICLLVHGDVPEHELGSQYNLQWLRQSEVKDPFLRERSFGYGWTKMVALWEAPFDTFLYLDADTVVWGDAREHALFDQADIITDFTGHRAQPEDMRKWFFDPEKMKEVVPDFDWEWKPTGYFCGGTFYARRGTLDLELYKQCQEWGKSIPGLFAPFGDMGPLNFMIHYAAQKGQIRLHQVPYQVLVPEKAKSELDSEFRFEGNEPVAGQSAKVIHWVGPKPILYRKSIFNGPMTFFRRRHFQNAASAGQVNSVLVREDSRHLVTFVRNKVKKRIRRTIRRSDVPGK